MPPFNRKKYKVRRSESRLTSPRQKRRENSTLSDYKDIFVPHGHVNLSKYSAPDDNAVRDGMIDTVIDQRSVIDNVKSYWKNATSNNQSTLDTMPSFEKSTAENSTPNQQISNKNGLQNKHS